MEGMESSDGKTLLAHANALVEQEKYAEAEAPLRQVLTLTQDEAVVSGHPGSDTRNREIFDECLSIVERAWAEDSFRHKYI